MNKSSRSKIKNVALRIRSPDLNESNFLTVEGKRVDKSQTLVKLRGDGC